MWPFHTVSLCLECRRLISIFLSAGHTHTQQQFGKRKHTLHKAMFLMALDRAAYGMKCCATGSDQRLSTFILKIFGDSDSHKFP